ncbi:amino acid ABC transporter ATP-binding protein [Acidisoma cladoniae]|uniref:amino acid ABC transporter ATP-binding protein n=1 Tax=Acidisoma cladoniae TaxID=3040935 RepID=UPI00254CFBB1|nr:amino acid ABC transporter ATP-binding protein [Acidisoma sp. PAMC 29798]
MSAQPMIDISGVSKSYGSVVVLRDVSLTVDASEVVCLIGASGSGKSTLLRCINFLERYDSGDIRIGGKLIGYVDDPKGQRRVMPGRMLREMRREIGFVFQQFNLWPHMSALQNVMEPLLRVRSLKPAAATLRAEAVLERVGLADKRHSFPLRMSGGQQQRVAIARALVMEPTLMLFDEPTSSLDPELVGEVLQVMKSLAADGMTMVVVTHEMGFAAHVANRVAFLDHGRIIACGPSRQVLHDSDEPRVRQFLQTYHDRTSF